MNKPLSYLERSNLAKHPLAKDLFQLMEDKKTNLCVSADLSSTKEILSLVDEIGPDISLLKTHIDIVQDFNTSFIADLKKLSDKHQFLIFEDRKFADIGNTVLHQYSGGIYRIAAFLQKLFDLTTIVECSHRCSSAIYNP